MKLIAVLLAAALALASAVAEATQQGQGALIGWKRMDLCAKQAQAAYPDFTTESNAKRDAKLKECLNASGLPPREPSTRPGAK